MAGGYTATSPVTNTKFKAPPYATRFSGNYAAAGAQLTDKEIRNCPRMLFPVTEFANVTLANGFTPANLRPGDFLAVVDPDVDGTTDCGFLIRRNTNDGWIKVAIDFSASPTVIATNVNDA